MEDVIFKWRSLHYYSFRNELIYFLILANTTPQVFCFLLDQVFQQLAFNNFIHCEAFHFLDRKGYQKLQQHPTKHSEF